MNRKQHLQHTVKNGPACKSGRIGGELTGEHITVSFDEFVQRPAIQCERCAQSKLFAFLSRTQWTPEHPDAWKLADDALIASRRR